MGSGRKPKENTSPDHAGVSGESSNGGGATSSSDTTVIEKQELVIPLTRINTMVHSLTSERDTVHVQQTAAGYEVIAPHGKLGYVPPNYEEAVRRSGSNMGIVVKLGSDPISAHISLS